jgi:hypothetical protein
MRYKLFLVTGNGVVEYGAHQGYLTLYVCGAAWGTVELLGEHRVWGQPRTSDSRALFKCGVQSRWEWFVYLNRI